jgi:hypothetical protein
MAAVRHRSRARFMRQRPFLVRLRELRKLTDAIGTVGIGQHLSSPLPPIVDRRSTIDVRDHMVLDPTNLIVDQDLMPLCRLPLDQRIA